MLHDHASQRESLARARAEEVLGRAPETFVCSLTVLASPAWRGIEADIWRAGADGRSIILKHFHGDISAYVEVGPALHACAQAGLLGIGPNVIASWPQDGLIAMEDLGTQWRAGGLHDGIDRDLRSAVIDRKKAFQAGAVLEKRTDIFAEIEMLAAFVRSRNIFAHRDVDAFLDYFNDARAKIAASGCDSAPCHRDGNTSNLMIGPEKAVKLLDFDMAAICDPFEDLGCHLVEFYECDADARLGFEEWHGSFDEGLFQRSMIYGLADDMRWGLIGAIMAATSARSSLEFSKYSAWRFVRLGAHVKRSDAYNRIRIAS